MVSWKKILLVSCALQTVLSGLADDAVFKSTQAVDIIPKQALEIKIPAFELKNNERAVLRFQVRRDLLSGWDNTLKIYLNNVRFDNENGILLNRPAKFSAGQYKNQRFHDPRGLLVFNTREWGTIDGSIKSADQRNPGCFVELDITDYVFSGKENTLKFLDSGKYKLIMQNLSIRKKSGVKQLAPDGSIAASMVLSESHRVNGVLALTGKGTFKYTFPAVKALGNSKRILRFQSRINGNSGWNTYLTIKVNGKPVNVQKSDGSSRLLNRGTVFSSKSWKNQNLATGSNYNVFFSLSFKSIDPQIIDNAQKKEANWMVLDCTDLCGNDAVELTIKSQFKGTLYLRNVEMGVLADEKSQPQALRMKLNNARKVIDHKVLKHGEKVVVQLPEFKNDTGLMPVLRFQSRMAYPELEGWNPYLNIKINGEPLDEQDKYAESRLLNRNNVFAAKGHPDQALATRSNWLTFFTNDFDNVAVVTKRVLVKNILLSARGYVSDKHLYVRACAAVVIDAVKSCSKSFKIGYHAVNGSGYLHGRVFFNDYLEFNLAVFDEIYVFNFFLFGNNLVTLIAYAVSVLVGVLALAAGKQRKNKSKCKSKNEKSL